MPSPSFAASRQVSWIRARTRRRRGRPRVMIIIENVSLAKDHRARKQVAALISAGFGVSVICRRDARNHLAEEVEEADLYEYPPPPESGSILGFVYEYAYSWGAATLLAINAFLRQGFDVIQAGHPPDIYFATALPFKVFRKAFVVDQRDLWPELYLARYGRANRPLLALVRLLEQISHRLADHVICVNETLREVAESRGGRSPGSVTVVGNGPVLAKTWRRPLRPELKEGKSFLCCWLGLMGPQDRLDLALQAIHHLVYGRGRRDCQVTFLGEGEMLGDLKELTTQLRIDEWVTFTGWVDEDVAFEYLSSADLGLEPAVQDEVSPVKGMEYMAFELPFVAFDMKETRRLAEAAAVYAKPNDWRDFARLICELLEDPERRAEMGRVGRAKVEQSLAWDHQKNSYVDVYKVLIKRSRTGG